MLQEVEQEVLIGQVVELIRSFRPDIVITFGPDGGYGHPDHIAISTATTAACQRSGDSTQFPEHLAAGLAPHRPARLYYSHFPAKRQLLLERLVQWLVTTEKRFHGTLDFVQALLLLSEESTLLRYSSDYCDVGWYPSGFFIIEQGEPADNLYLILSGTVEVMREDPDGTQHVVAHMGPGSFFGEEGLASRQPRNAHVIAVDNVTCLVFSPQTPTAFLGRGEGARITNLADLNARDEVLMTGATTCIDVGPYMKQKIEAISAHRSQYALEPDMLPLSILEELMGQEYFVRVYPVPDIETDFLPL
jgi:LmbE family N-acetylglucosaminyl deacetylase